MYPFLWPYSFASIMPSAWLHDLLDSPCPYIYGCLYDTMSNLPLTLDNETVRVDLDSNTIETGLDDGFFLPLDLRQTLQSSLEYIVRFRLVKSNTNLLNIAVSEACLHVFIELFYRLPDFFQRIPDVVTKPAPKNQSVSIISTSFQSHDSGIDVQPLVFSEIGQESTTTTTTTTKDEYRKEENRFGYDFRSDEFLMCQPTTGYVAFLNDFIHGMFTWSFFFHQEKNRFDSIIGMIFMKFLDDYQRNDDNNSSQMLSIFCQRLKERRRMTRDELSINPVIRFRQTFDLLEKQIKQTSRSINPTLSKFMKKLFE